MDLLTGGERSPSVPVDLCAGKRIPQSGGAQREYLGTIHQSHIGQGSVPLGPSSAAHSIDKTELIIDFGHHE